MKIKDKIFVVFGLYFWCAVGLFFTGSLFYLVFPAVGIVWLFIGGKKNVL